MAGFSLLALLDDIASMLDDVSLMTKVAVKKTAGVLGDDLALNVQQVSGVAAQKELPLVWAVAKGSLLNKCILVPAALVISAFMPWLITPLLMVGGAYLSYEGMEKLLLKLNLLRHEKPEDGQPSTDTGQLEKKKIRGAIRTDFILSAEIIIIALGTLPPDAAFSFKAIALSVIGLIMTAGVYGLVAAIIKLDDAGLWLIRHSQEQGAARKFGEALVSAAPKIMRFLTIVGTAAMFLVGGGILVHGLPWLHTVTAYVSGLPLPALFEMLLNLAVGLLAGSILCLPALIKTQAGTTR